MPHIISFDPKLLQESDRGLRVHWYSAFVTLISPSYPRGAVMAAHRGAIGCIEGSGLTN
jgi:hypothetical protein